MSTKVYILLPVHNRRDITEKFIDCLAGQTYSNYHLILIDDGSTDGTSEMVKGRITNLTILKGGGDWWWAGSLQQGINWLEHQEVADRDIVVFANDDITFEKDFIQKAVGILEGVDSTFLLPQVRDGTTGKPMESGVEVDFKKFTFSPASYPDRINCLPTRGLFMRMADLRRVGGFYPKLLPHYWSDYEYTIRARKKGIKLHTNASITICVDQSTSGIRNFSQTSFQIFLKQFFSKKAVSNPLYTSMFIIKASPMIYMPISLLKVWRYATISILRNLGSMLKRRLKEIQVLAAIHLHRKNLKIIIGAASTKQKGWTSTNFPQLDLTNCETFSSLFLQESIGNFLAEHVWEHLSLEEGELACKNCFRFLRRGGVLRIAVPDGFHPDADYIAQVKPGGYGAGADDHKVLFNYRTLSKMLEGAGYKVRLLEWFDENGEFHHEKWDETNGLVMRSTCHDQRNHTNPTAYTSLIVDAIKPS